MIDVIPGPVLLIDQAGLITACNQPAVDCFLQSQPALLERHLTDLLPARFKPHFNDQLAAIDQRADPAAILTLNGDLQGLRGDGTEFPIQLSLRHYPAAAPGTYLVLVLDASEKLQSHNRYKLSFEQSSEGLLITSREGIIQMANPALLHLFKYTAEELVGKPVEMLLPTANQRAHEQYRNAYLVKPTLRRMGIGKDLFGVCKDGQLIPIEVGLAPFSGTRQTEILVTVLDISQRKQIESDRSSLESKIQQTQKLESLGLLTGGIAHDFNNILTGIVGNAELAMMELPALSGVRRYLQRLLDSSYRAAELCEQMLAYSGGGKRIHEKFSLNDLIESTMDLIHASIAESASLGLHLARDLPLVEGDVTQLRQVIMNLVINASEAIIDKHGVINVSTGVMDLYPVSTDATPGVVEDVQPGKYAYVLVSDNGAGMSKEVQARIFDPFFTTKFTGRGLGLAAVLGIVRNHRGVIRLYSEEGIGTSFRILLPFEGGMDQLPSEPVAEAKESGLILIIDDEANVHQVVGDTLRGRGFSTLSAPDGREGLELFKQHMKELKLVILDLTMPNMGGEETYRHLRHLNTNVPVIITSGYSEQEILNRFVGRGIAGFLQKPISPFKLLELVKKAVPPPS